MIYYFAIFILSLLLLFEKPKKRVCQVSNGVGMSARATNNGNLIIFFIAAVVLFLIAALRFETGHDWDAYLEIYNNSFSVTNWTNFEHGYILINRFFNFFTKDYYIFQFFLNCFYSISVFSFFYKESDNPVFTLLVYILLFYFFGVDMSLNRMQVAVGIIVLGRRFIHNKKFIIWCLLVFIASRFHITALLALPLYWTSRIKISKKVALFLLVFSLFIHLFGLALTSSVVSLFKTMSFLPSRIIELLERYTTGSSVSRQAEINSGVGIFITYFFYLVICLNVDKKSNKKANGYVLNFLIGLIIIGFGRNLDMIRRITNYYMISGGGLIAYNLILSGDYKHMFGKNSTVDKQRFVRIVISTLFIVYSVVTFSKGYFDSYIKYFNPYKDILLR